jgi:hypothetical protein
LMKMNGSFMAMPSSLVAVTIRCCADAVMNG